MPYAEYIDGGLESVGEKGVCHDIWDGTQRRKWRPVSEEEASELRKQLTQEEKLRDIK